MLDVLKLDHYFDAIVAAEDVTAGKPDPQVFLAAAAKLHTPPASCVVVEDAAAGSEAARRAGMKCLAVTNSHPVELLSEATTIVKSLEEVTLQFLQKLCESTI